MNKKMIGIAVLALAAGVFGACGGDDDSSSAPKAGSGGGGGAGGSGAVFCAKETCTPVDGIDAEPCCMDPFAGGCGIKAGASCRAKPQNVNMNCPVPDLGNFMLPGTGGNGGMLLVPCCTSDNECGVDYGMGGCISSLASCSMIPKQLLSSVHPMTCDGMAQELPPDCGIDLNIPGFPTGGTGGAGGGS